MISLLFRPASVLSTRTTVPGPARIRYIAANAFAVSFSTEQLLIPYQNNDSYNSFITGITAIVFGAAAVFVQSARCF